MRVALISCVKKKKRGYHRARDLYASPLFRLSLAYTSHFYDAVYVLSAKYGLLGLDRRINSYEVSLKHMPASRRRLWARAVAEQIDRTLPAKAEIHFFCGKRYREFLIEALGRRSCFVPLEGLGLGKQMRWYKNKTPR